MINEPSPRTKGIIRIQWPEGEKIVKTAKETKCRVENGGEEPRRFQTYLDLSQSVPRDGGYAEKGKVVPAPGPWFYLSIHDLGH